MADVTDRATKREEQEREASIAAARACPPHLQGPARCQCGAPNDRRREGWALCSDCQAEMETADRVRDEGDG